VIAEPQGRPRPRVAPALWVALVLAAMFAVLWAGPGAAAGATRARPSIQATPPPDAVKYYIVPRAGNGPAESLSLVAARTLGSGSRYLEIFNLNRGRRQPNGGRLENPAVIEPGWVLLLPPDAAGPGVQFGTLPTSGAPIANRVTHRVSRSAAASPTAFSWVDVAGPVVVGAAMAGLAVAIVRRRRAGRRGRKPATAHALRRRAGRGPNSAAPGGLGIRAADAQAADMDWLDALDEGGWRDWGSPPALHPDHPSAPQPRIDRPAGRLLNVAVSDGNSQQQATLVELRSADSLWLAQRVLSEADQQAAEITLEAQGQAAALRAAAQQEAAEIKQRASDQAAALLAAAEWDAAHMRTAVMTMSAELGQVAAYVTENLTVSPARPAAKPEAQPAQTPTARPRQYAAMRIVVAAVAALVLFAVMAGATELGLHGYPFFVFRSAGTGATPSGGLNEDQGPGQPHAPRAHIHSPGTHQPQRVHKSPKAAGGHHG
jgi:hypothetical protein